MSVPFILNFEKKERMLENPQIPPVRSLAHLVFHPYSSTMFVDTLQFCCCFGGDTEICRRVVNGREYICRYPHIFIKRPNEFHVVKEGKFNTVIYFTYDRKYADAIRALGVEDELSLCPMPESAAFHALFMQLQEFARHSEEFGVVDQIDMLCFQIVREILLARKLEQTPLAEADEKIRRIASYLRLNCMQEIDFDELARQHGFSRRTFSRHWEKSGYPSPAQFLFELRMMEAKRLLAETSTPIWKIAELLHYQGSAWFCFSFRKHTGETPLGFRKRSQRPSGLELN